MSDYPFFSDRDPIITWASITPTQRPLADLRGKVSDAWEKYFQACDRFQEGECKFEHLEFTRIQAEAIEASYRKAYATLNAPAKACLSCKFYRQFQEGLNWCNHPVFLGRLIDPTTANHCAGLEFEKREDEHE